MEKLNKHPGIQGWWGHTELVNDDEDSRHVHIAILYPKAVLKFTVTKWLKKHLAHTETWTSGKLQWKAGVCTKIWYNDVWVKAYMDGEKLGSKWELTEEVLEQIHEAYPDKDDQAAVKPTRKQKPAVPDRVAARWQELYPQEPRSIHMVFDFIRYMMYTEKSIGFMNKLKLQETAEHVWYMLCHKNTLPIMWEIPADLKAELLQKVESRKVADNQGPATTPEMFKGLKKPLNVAAAPGGLRLEGEDPPQTPPHPLDGGDYCAPARPTTQEFLTGGRGPQYYKNIGVQTNLVGLSRVDSDIGVHMDSVVPINTRTTPAANVDDEVMLVLGHNVREGHLSPGTTRGLELVASPDSEPDTP